VNTAHSKWIKHLVSSLSTIALEKPWAGLASRAFCGALSDRITNNQERKLMYKFIHLAFISVVVLSGCASSYVTPGGHVDLSNVPDNDIKKIYEQKPTASFPANLAYTRVQETGYSNYSSQAYGSGSFSVITTRDIESDEDIARLAGLPDIEGITPLSKIIIPAKLSGLRDLRLSAAKLHADILLVYTLDTTFTVGKKSFAPMELISFGSMDNKEVRVTATASAAFYDAKTEYLYGLAEATQQEIGHSDIWNNSKVVDDLRKLAEKKAFHNLVPEIENTWDKITTKYKQAK